LQHAKDDLNISLLSQNCSASVGPTSAGLLIGSFGGAEIGEVSSFISNHRLVTLTGAGGIGKTPPSSQLERRRASERQPQRRWRPANEAILGSPSCLAGLHTSRQLRC
jgi:hypothetical protein